MKTFYSFFAIFLFISSFASAQNYKESLPAKSAEAKEIKATNHLKKELEQRQLSASPERIADTTAGLLNTDKRKNKKCVRRMHKSNG